MTKKFSWTALVLLAVLGLAAYGLSPLLAIRELKAASVTGDRDQLEEVVDFPVLRENLKAQFNAGYLQSMTHRAGAPAVPSNVARDAAFPVAIGHAIDSTVTPDGVAMLLSQSHSSAPEPTPSFASLLTLRPTDLNTSWGYRTLDRFRIDIGDPAKPDERVALILERCHLFNWKLIRIDFPHAFLDQLATEATPATVPTAPPGLVTPNVGDGCGLCEAVALVSVPSSEDPSSVLKPGEIDEDVTQYQVNKKTGVGVFCAHGGFCYPRFMMVNGRRQEVLRLTNCTVGSQPVPGYDEESVIYSVDVDRTKNSAVALRCYDVNNALLEAGMCSACAGNTTNYYLAHPTSRCGQ